ncbi:unnamed protein product [Symbiodinium natans]|uniref:Uncharacterized protein n=1 Tax=Symbiodinium natans TaxID=878477 RepID=A0A812QR22_9DINO|nr:unnamed protein product [Symbiodinium natans]
MLVCHLVMVARPVSPLVSDMNCIRDSENRGSTLSHAESPGYVSWAADHAEPAAKKRKKRKKRKKNIHPPEWKPALLAFHTSELGDAPGKLARGDACTPR